MSQALSLPRPDESTAVVAAEDEFWSQVEQWARFLRKLSPGAFACKTAAYAYEPSVVARVMHVIAVAIQPKDAASWGTLIPLLPGLLYLQVTAQERDATCVTAQEVLQEALWLLLFEKLQAIWSSLATS